LRDEGNVSDILFSDIRFTAQYQAAPWWGRGEAISFTAIRRKPGAQIGSIDGVQVRNIIGRAENSIRINGSAESRIRNVTLDNVAVAFDRWTKYPGEVFDNRPTTAHTDVERHKTPGISVRYADNVTLKDCKVVWTQNPPAGFTHAIEAENTSGLSITRFTGEAAHRDRDPDILIR
jgi:hypothetical protein